jgi:hypothetical protein
MSNSNHEEGNMHDPSDHYEVGGEVMGGFEAFGENCSENRQDDTYEGKSNSYIRTNIIYT